ncbi:MAG: MarR family transcriptional regulator [Nocardioidaceae bacterium]
MTARWLTLEEQHAWRAYMVGTTLLMERLDRDLREGHGLSLPEYEILVRLSEAPEHRLRMAELADSVKNSRSRITHAVTRLEKAGLVERSQCTSDGRGVFAILTDHGYHRLVAMAPDHVASVRAALIDVVSSDDLAAIRRGLLAVAEGLQTGGPDPLLSEQPA